MDNKAPVTTQHADYVRMKPKWDRARDVCEGQDAVHAAGSKYLPRLRKQQNEEYEAYKLRASFYAAGWRTVAGLEGMLFRKPPAVDAPESVKPLLDDVTLGGESLHIFAQGVAEEILIVGRVGVLNDYPVAPDGLTQADAQRLNLRPTLAMYRTEAIINWRWRRIANVYSLVMVVLCEKNSTETADGFGEKEEDQYRVLDLDPAGFYRQRIFRLNDEGAQYQVDGDLYPLLNAKPLDYLPFQFIGPGASPQKVDEPPLIDLFDMNLSHYRTTADLEHGCHWTGLSQPWVTGWTPENDTKEVYYGGGGLWHFPDAETKVGILSLNHDFAALASNIERKEQQMAVLGARMLEALKKGIESAETAGIHRVGEESMLASVALAVSIGLTKALQWFTAWAGASGNASIDLNRDFFPVPMSAIMLQQLVAGWQAGAYSFDTLFQNLQQGEVIAPDANAEDEQAKMANAAPVLMGTKEPPLPLAA